jgi:hypothetical protein
MPVMPATWEEEMGESLFETSLGKKLARFHLKEQAGHGGDASH